MAVALAYSRHGDRAGCMRVPLVSLSFLGSTSQRMAGVCGLMCVNQGKAEVS
jgi:hypothetical protein